ncbi:MAG: FAD-dependent oxidoreductase [Candidatus Coatesbacteria bacterium]
MPVGAVLVVGGGIGGMQAALDLAAAGIKVHLVEHGPAIGGGMAQLDKTFPTNDCAMCTLAPRLVEVSRNPDIELHTLADVERLEGEPGDFRATVKLRPRYVDLARCTGCGACMQVCAMGKVKPSPDPKRVQPIPDEFNGGLSFRPAIHIPFPQAIPNAAVIDAAHCLHFKSGSCVICQKHCKALAVDFGQKESREDLAVGAVVVAPGFDLFDPRLKPEYGYGALPNVVSSLELERLLSASGPTRGHLARPSDGRAPGRIAFIQCVGSRDNQRDYCSSICCMAATKEALLAKQHVGGDLACDIFAMDLRAYGKGFEEYAARAEASGVRYVRCRPAGVAEAPGSHDLRVAYLTEDGRKVTGEYDLVVLAAGLAPPRAARSLAATFGLLLDRNGFSPGRDTAPVDTPRDGVFVAGAFTAPRDIPETVMQAGAAVSRSLELLADARHTLTAKVAAPPETDVRGQAPRIGVFVCHCGSNIAGVVDVAAVADHARALPGVEHAEHLLYTCSTDSQQKIRDAIREHGLNRVVVAACTPRTHEPLFRSTIREGGLNPYLFEMANIRDQDAWVHAGDPPRATAKAEDLVRAAVAKAGLLEPLVRRSVPISREVLVIGGGLSGMTAALSLANQGFETHLVEREPALGGNLSWLRFLIDAHEDPRTHFDRLAAEVRGHPRVTVYAGARIGAITGSVGNFETTLVSFGSPARIRHGAIIVATGAQEERPAEYRYGANPSVLTQRELEQRLAGGASPPASVVMIQCVGSRDARHPYCSRICCGQAIKNALRIKSASPGTAVTILYRDVRAYGLREAAYTEARRRGVVFARYDPGRKPEVLEGSRNDPLLVRFFEPVVRRQVALEAGWVVLAPAIVPRPGAAELARLLKVPLDVNGFFLEAHMKLRPVDFAADGIFLCGMAHGPKTVDESSAQALAAAARVAGLLATDSLSLEACVSEVIEANCDGCAYCVEVCPYKALTLLEYASDGAVKKTIEVNETLCKGCGTCQATCPKKGISVRGFRLEQLSAMVEAMLPGGARG